MEEALDAGPLLSEPLSSEPLSSELLSSGPLSSGPLSSELLSSGPRNAAKPPSARRPEAIPIATGPTRSAPTSVDEPPGVEAPDATGSGADRMPPEGSRHPRERDAEVLVELGFSLIPLRPHSKRPVPGRWKMAQVAAAALPALVRDLGRHPDANLAVVTGQVSGIVVVDLDNDDTVTWAHEHLPPTRLTVSTARGEHWYYRLEGACRSFNPMRHVEGLAINVKGDGGYVVAPGSRHPTGDRYMPTTTWTQALLASVPLFQRTWFEADPAHPTSTATENEVVLSPQPGESAHGFGQRVFREMNRAMRRGDHKRLRELAALLKQGR